MATQANNPFRNIKKGALHRMLGVKQGDKIPADKLHGALHSSNPLERKRANFALNAKKFNHKKKKAVPSKQDTDMALKKKATYPTTNKGEEGDIEKKRKSVKSKSIGMGGDKEMKRKAKKKSASK